MDAQRFLEEFGHIANAPGGIARLRDMVLSLAFQAKLCPFSEESADSLLEAIEQQRQAFTGETRKQRLARQSEAVNTASYPFAIPDHWRWVGLSTVGHTWGQKKPSSTFTYIDVSSIDNKRGCLADSLETLSAETAPSRARKIVKQGTLVYSTVRPYLLNIAIVDREFESEPIASTAFAIIHPWSGVLVRYLYFFLRSPIFVRYVESVQIGMAYPAISDEKFYAGLIPLPPTEEQTRIVAKVDELMALCDKLEAQQQDRRKLQNALRQSTLQAVAASPHELQTAWNRLAESFGLFFCAPEDVTELRKLILDMAVAGYLSQHEQSDEPALDLLGKLLRTKQKLIAEGEVARRKPVKAEELQETTIPAHWETITLDDAISTIDAGWSPACLSRPRDDETKWGILKTTSVQTLRFLPHEHKELPASLEPRPQYEVQVGDILITRAGPKNRVGICCVVDQAPPRLMISDKLIRFHIVDDLINARFIALCLSAGEPGRILERLKSGMADSQMNISQDKLRAITIPLPPMHEQLRILEKIEILMRMIDKLEQQLRNKAGIADRFAVSAVSSITGIAIEQEEDEPMKAPQTKLIAPLRLGQAPDIKAQAPLAAILARHHDGMNAKDLWQRFGGEIDAFYAQLKLEVSKGWIREPAVAEMRVVEAD
ncbi:restriction endonuclease subunit S [Methylocaldum gracile subsp. desertum]|uniref:restriction endonuclease subunit S n=1 Tax=Methylocaldum sp. GT1BW TaxID=3438964 RepID=UPI003DA03E2B